ncbi:MAG: DUF3574 domain-containing protein [Bacteroidales bacterium]|nr:DUF3574 domain-containing protein [Bacteroidales bacterium]
MKQKENLKKILTTNKFGKILFTVYLILIFMMLSSCEKDEDLEYSEWIKTELYFGMDIPNGGEVSDVEWETFLETEITPLFPDGYTVFTATGLWADEDTNESISERSRVLSIVYKTEEEQTVNNKITIISNKYIEQFNQNAVLRIDTPVIVTFL